MRKADSEAGQVTDAIQMAPNELISGWEIAQQLNSLRQEGGEGSIFHASQPASGGGSHQGLREIAGLDRGGNNSHSRGNQVDPDDKAECP